MRCANLGEVGETNSLERALVLLKLIEQTPGGLRNADISRQLDIPKSSCSYIVSRLEREGYLIKDAASNRYKIGLTPVALAHGALREVGIRTVAEPALYKLTNQTGLSAGIGVLQKGRVLLVDRVEGPRFVDRAIQAAASRTARNFRVRAQRDIGRELPAHSTALGKVLLAFSPRQQVLDVIAKLGLARSTAATIVSKKRFLAELDLVRKQGYAVADGEAYADLRALSVPIFDTDGEVRAAVSVNGDPSEPVWDDLPTLVKTVEDAARDISRRARILLP
ncbi:MAG: IclR family transcriptional regulator [Acidobacteriia bacterium]|nr:IclR family transcriptional regulator [Terriglobia bacterium]